MNTEAAKAFNFRKDWTLHIAVNYNARTFHLIQTLGVEDKASRMPDATINISWRVQAEDHWVPGRT